MGVDVTLWRVEKTGSSPRRWRRHRVGMFLDGDESFARACAGSSQPMLTRVDTYGSLVLSSEEMEQFIAELRTLDISDVVVVEILDLAQRCTASDHELRLDGD